MFRFKTGILIAVLSVLTATAGATPIAFSLQDGTFGSGATMSGTVVIDTATGSMVSADLTYAFGGSSVTFDRAFGSQGVEELLLAGNLVPATYGEIVDGPGPDPNVLDAFDLLLPGASLIGYAGGPVCSSVHYCGGGSFSEYFGRTNFLGNDFMATGNLVPLTATPEPSELALTLTGAALCGLIAIRRFRPPVSQNNRACSH